MDVFPQEKGEQGGGEKRDRRVNVIIWRLILQNYAVPIYSVQSANAELLQWVILSF